MRTYFQSNVRLESATAVESITSGKAERQLEQSVLLVSIDATAFTYGKCLATEVFVVAVVSQESTECNVRGYVITTFKTHTPSAGFISEVVAQGEVELPIDVGITVIG